MRLMKNAVRTSTNSRVTHNSSQSGVLPLFLFEHELLVYVDVLDIGRDQHASCNPLSLPTADG